MSDREALENAQNVEELLDAFEDDLHPAWTGEERVRGLVWHVLRKKLLVVLEENERLRALQTAHASLGEIVDRMAARIDAALALYDSQPASELAMGMAEALKGKGSGVQSLMASPVRALQTAHAIEHRRRRSLGEIVDRMEGENERLRAQLESLETNLTTEMSKTIKQQGSRVRDLKARIDAALAVAEWVNSTVSIGKEEQVVKAMVKALKGEKHEA